MGPMKWRYVVERTGRATMSKEEARTLVSDAQPVILRNQALALSLMTWSNTAEDWLRLQACLVLLRGRRGARR
jgi:hypothetical protein